MLAHRIFIVLLAFVTSLLIAATAVQVAVAVRAAEPLAPTGSFAEADQALIDQLRGIFALPTSAEDLRDGVPRETVLAADEALLASAEEMCGIVDQLLEADLDPREEATVHSFGHSIAEPAHLDDEAGEAAYLAYLAHCEAA